MKKVPEDLNPLNRGSYCGDPGALVSYLYNDGSPEELAAIAAHVQVCVSCTAELSSLGDTRDLLSTWSPPQTELGLTLSASDALPVAAVVPATFAASSPSDAVVAADLPWWRQSTPVWMQAAAATMVFAAGMAVGTSGRGAAPSSSTSTARVAQPTLAQPTGVSRRELADLEERLRAEIARLPSVTVAQPAAQTAARTADDEAVLKRVQSLLAESEERQRGELALRTAQVLRDIEIQRKVDIATLQRDIGQIQGVTGAELKRQGELQNMLINRVGLQGR